jgi:hypothetical protein
MSEFETQIDGLLTKVTVVVSATGIAGPQLNGPDTFWDLNVPGYINY